ncbi:glycosyltransferase [Lyngbya sp. CCY1209]|jgi:glycosyltransferase involved in cell wall biosynthesis|uniref:glycosyltransferase n=1 Tax=Lyngbya sp. CCY1209 TaxID=2886103 RepID=UPI002D201274|nr:glycosyltransferase [Lyngbya sp. CCY1209]MEB3887044.1 glycosyltransferase [Lyngbya sp. CCY1209]
MTKIAIFLSSLDGGGAERVMINLASGFADRGMSVDLILVKAEGPYLSQISPKVRVIDFQKQRLLEGLPKLISYLKAERPVALLSALEDTNVVALLAHRLAQVKTQAIVTVHNNLSRESQNATQLKRKLSPLMVRWFYPWADAVVSVSKGVADDLLKIGLNSQKIHVIYNPIVTNELLETAQQPIEHDWFFPDQPPVILAVGRLNQQKDFPTLIHAFAQVRQQQRVRLMILGEGEERSNLASLVTKLGLEEEVDFPGFVANPYAYMARSAVLVLSSAWEGFGNVLVEAMAVGTPVVSTNCESGPSEILDNGRYGALVNVGDRNEMAKAILQMIASPTDSVVIQKRADTFSLENAVDKYHKLWR